MTLSLTALFIIYNYTVAEINNPWMTVNTCTGSAFINFSVTETSVAVYSLS